MPCGIHPFQLARCPWTLAERRWLIRLPGSVKIGAVTLVAPGLFSVSLAPPSPALGMISTIAGFLGIAVGAPAVLKMATPDDLHRMP